MPRILLVGGEADFRARVRQALEQEGYVVDEAAAGADGLARLRQGAYDLVITELYLPDMMVLELIAAVRSMGRAAPLTMILTALGDWGTYAHALELGLTAYLTKPLGMAELSHQVARALSGRRSPSLRGVVASEEAA